MPRPNRHRTLGSERTLAQRLAFEREERGWTYEALAKRMDTVGCPIQPSALYKIEKADPPRRVTVDELVALANVFGHPIEEMLLPVALVNDKRARNLVRSWAEARERVIEADAERQAAESAIKRHVERHPEAQDALEDVLRGWARNEWGQDIAEEAAEYWSLQLRGVDHGSDEYQDWLTRAAENFRSRS
jgi:transcriptional regulator with XRE-family HTH domain